MGNEKEVTAVKEQAAEREKALRGLAERLRQETDGIHIPEIPIADVLNLPQHEAQTSPIIQTTDNPITNKGGEQGSTDKSSTWKEATEKRKQDKEAKKG
jgi:hypothetical protein